MGKDLEIVAYRGAALADATIADLVHRLAPHVALFRHSVAAGVRAPVLSELRCIAFYERVGRDGAQEPSPNAPAAHLFFSESMLANAKREAAAGGSLASVVRAAWTMIDEAEKRFSDVETNASEPANARRTSADGAVAVARELSRIAGEAFLAGYADHSGIGIYARFLEGELVFPTSPADVYAEHDDYVGATELAWSSALGGPVRFDAVVAQYFPDEAEPPLFAAEAPASAIPFDASQYVMTLAD